MLPKHMDFNTDCFIQIYSYGAKKVSTDPKKLERPMPRKQRFGEAEDELMLRAWLRWHAQHGFERECFTQGRDRLPLLNLREVQVRARGLA